MVQLTFLGSLLALDVGGPTGRISLSLSFLSFLLLASPFCDFSGAYSLSLLLKHSTRQVTVKKNPTPKVFYVCNSRTSTQMGCKNERKYGCYLTQSGKN